MYKTKLNKIGNLIEKIKNDINIITVINLLGWFYNKINLNFSKKINNKYPKQGDIRNVKLGINIGSEQNGESTGGYIRPCLIIRTFGIKNDNLIILPLTKSKKPEYISYKLLNPKYTFLRYYESYILLDQVKTISKKRLIGSPLGKISTNDLEKILTKFNLLFIITNKNRIKNKF